MGVRVISIFIFLVSLSIQGFGQNHEVVERNGEKYYVHTVEKGNTIYAISRMYGVDEAYIEGANENLENGLSIGQKILIPLKFRDRKFKKKPKPEIKDEFIVHTVSKKETLYRISRNYSIDLNDLLDANPGTTEDLKRGQKIVIPLSSVKPKDESHVIVASEDSLIHHTVEKGQTLYAISKLYKVSVQDIMNVNSGMTETLSTGSNIRIPILRELERDIDELTELREEDVEFIPIEVKNVALLLPFEYEDVDSMASNSSRRNAFALIDLAIEFYRGSKMACEDYSANGGNVNLMVFTMRNDTREVDKCLKEGWLDECDVVIGPFHKKSFTELSSRLAGKDKIMISPNLRSNSILNNERVFKVNPDKIKEIEFLAEQVASMHHGENILVVRSPETKDQVLWKTMEQKLNKALQEQDDRLFNTVKLVDMEEEGPKEERTLVLATELYKDTNNVFVVPSNDLSFVSDVITKLNRNELSNNDVKVYGMESWAKFDNIDIHYKQNLDLRLSATKYLNYEHPGVRNFMRRYYRSYETIPSEKGYAFLAYDISQFALNSLESFGNRALENLDKIEHEPIYQNISLEKTDTGSWHNKGFFFLNHRDFKLVKTD
ncbi:MAG: LysM peptidoglycan-binding domain-containing protein [Flavobacteriales bacterium]|nr:LysM peptidoglycan-binding domain-containing protein [Flavobacteriales bacterium]